MMHKLLIAAAALSVLASAALAKDVNKASIQELESGGLQGGIGCLYVYTDVGLFTLPLNQSPNTPQIVAAMNLMTHATASFNLGSPSPICYAAGNAPTILLPSTP